MAIHPITAAVNEFGDRVKDLIEATSNKIFSYVFDTHYSELKKKVFFSLVDQYASENLATQLLNKKSNEINRLNSEVEQLKQEKMALEKRLKETDQDHLEEGRRAECGVCYRAYNGAILPVVGCCGHSICKRCKVSLRQGKNCPLCREDSSFCYAERNYLAEELLTILNPEAMQLEPETLPDGEEEEEEEEYEDYSRVSPVSSSLISNDLIELYNDDDRSVQLSSDDEPLPDVEEDGRESRLSERDRPPDQDVAYSGEEEEEAVHFDDIARRLAEHANNLRNFSDFDPLLRIRINDQDELLVMPAEDEEEPLCEPVSPSSEYRVSIPQYTFSGNADNILDEEYAERSMNDAVEENESTEETQPRPEIFADNDAATREAMDYARQWLRMYHGQEEEDRQDESEE